MWDDTVSPPTRTILAVDLREVTITADPAYTDTEIGLRALEAAKAVQVRVSNFNSAARRIQRKISLDIRQRA
jgi:phage head maturation protease